MKFIFPFTIFRDEQGWDVYESLIFWDLKVMVALKNGPNISLKEYLFPKAQYAIPRSSNLFIRGMSTFAEI